LTTEKTKQGEADKTHGIFIRGKRKEKEELNAR